MIYSVDVALNLDGSDYRLLYTHSTTGNESPYVTNQMEISLHS